METAPQETVPQETEASIEHQNVPVAHRGLHDFLYSSADEHGVGASTAPAATIESVADQVLPLEDWCALAGDAKVAGVYGVWDGDRQLQYVNISRNVALSLKGHLTQLGADLCAFVRVQPFAFPKREVMAALQAAWIVENGPVPLGNRDTDSLWAETTGAAALAAMSATERAAYEEKKLKLRKAMADSSLGREQPVVSPDSATDATRRQDLEHAVQGDDWSGVIREQTQKTL